MSHEKSSPLGVGVLTLLTILLVLTLAVFSVLSFSSARADLSLSQTNAAMVAAYYRAEGEAEAQKAAFLAGGAPEYEARIPMTDAQDLYIHLARRGGDCAVLAWKTVPTEERSVRETLPVWDGSSVP